MTYTVAVHMPKHYRPMTLAEIGRVKWGAILTVLDTHSGDVAQCHAIGDAKDSSVVVKFRGGHVETLGAANPDEQEKDDDGVRDLARQDAPKKLVWLYPK